MGTQGFFGYFGIQEFVLFLLVWDFRDFFEFISIFQGFEGFEYICKGFFLVVYPSFEMCFGFLDLRNFTKIKLVFFSFLICRPVS